MNGIDGTAQCWIAGLSLTGCMVRSIRRWPECSTRRIWQASVIAAVLVVASTASAQTPSPTDLVARQELLQCAWSARTTGDHTRALDCARRAGQIQMTPSVRQLLAEEQNSLGDLAEALGNAEQCVREAERDHTVPRRIQILRACGGLVIALRPRIGHVTVHVPSPPPEGLEVTVAGHGLNSALYGVPYPVTPGTVAVGATAPGRAQFRQEISVTAGSALDVSVALEPLAPRELPPHDEPLIIQTPHHVTGPTTPFPRPPVSRGTGLGVGPFVVMGIGTLSLGSSLLFLLLRDHEITSFEANCDPDENSVCRNRNGMLMDQLRGLSTLNDLANVTFFAGLGVVAVGAGWLILNHWSHERPRTNVSVIPTAGGAVLGLAGSL